ncbi:hypothetical protein E2F50_19575 [Rhizobium deserti]|uniref:Uncharacterized protein n=1 Tax=Rhizobium deserti TaxID=2547961 RepID=A0A4R5UAL6_9HYPH|nr:hypothetical protein [Rhizobium deserti]TDK31861.1 hypothetical protein E2F50_19575 [Rhizobium deserti]
MYVAIVLILALTSFKLTSGSRPLLIGLPADEGLVTANFSDVHAQAVMTINGMASVHPAPGRLPVAPSIWFYDGLSKKGVEAEIEGIGEDCTRRIQRSTLFSSNRDPRAIRGQFTARPFDHDAPAAAEGPRDRRGSRLERAGTDLMYWIAEIEYAG